MSDHKAPSEEISDKHPSLATSSRVGIRAINLRPDFSLVFFVSLQQLSEHKAPSEEISDKHPTQAANSRVGIGAIYLLAWF